jgi:site-specific DNA recombinase
MVTGLSIGAVTSCLNELGVPTKKGAARWERSMVWDILRNPTYNGTACFGKTQQATQQAARERTNNRTLRQRVAYPRVTVPAMNCRLINGFRFWFPR